jgi:hypothetical protein
LLSSTPARHHTRAGQIYVVGAQALALALIEFF